MVEHLDFFQSFDDVKVYYDNGQDIVKQALDRSVGKVLSKGVVRRRKTSMTDYRLEQVADYLCTIELGLVKYEAKEDGETYNKFFGGIGSFKRNWLKQARSKRIWMVPQPHKEAITSPSVRRQTAGGKPRRQTSSSESRSASKSIADINRQHSPVYKRRRGFA